MEIAHEVTPAPGAALDADAEPRRRRGPLLWVPATCAAGLVALLVVAVLRPATTNPLQPLNRFMPTFGDKEIKRVLRSLGAKRSAIRRWTTVSNMSCDEITRSATTLL